MFFTRQKRLMPVFDKGKIKQCRKQIEIKILDSKEDKCVYLVSHKYTLFSSKIY